MLKKPSIYAGNSGIFTFSHFFVGNAENFRHVLLVASRQRKTKPNQTAKMITTRSIQEIEADINLRVVRGAYQHASDDCLSRWYIQDDDGPVSRIGRGYRTRRLALDALAAIEAGMDLSAMPTD